MQADRVSVEYVVDQLAQRRYNYNADRVSVECVDQLASADRVSVKYGDQLATQTVSPSSTWTSLPSTTPTTT